MRRSLALCLILGLSGVAQAQPWYPPPPGYYPPPVYYPPPPPPSTYRGPYPNPYYRGERGFGAPAAVCQKLCLQDSSPCDPPEFKRADGRCTNPLQRF